MRINAAILVTATLLLGADAPREPPADSDQKALQGQWQSESSTLDGQKLERAKQRTDLVVDKDQISWRTSRLMGDMGQQVEETAGHLSPPGGYVNHLCGPNRQGEAERV
jgi:hypothetical protein